MCAKIVVSRMLLCLWLTVGLCIWLGAAPAGAVPTMEWNGNQTVTGGVNVGSSTDAATAQVKIKSTTASPTVAWHTTPTAHPFDGPALGSSTYDPDNVWTGEDAILSDSDEGAYAYVSVETSRLEVYGFDLNLPSGTTISGVEVSYRMRGDSYTSARFQLVEDVYFMGIGTAKPVTLTDSWTTGTLGGSGDLWGAGSVPSGFRVRIWMVGTPPYYDLSLDYVKVKVYYTTTTVGQWLAGAYVTDGSWRLVNNLTSLNSNVKLAVDLIGNVGIGTASPGYPLHMASNARCTVGGVWTNNSSLASKLDIVPVPTASAWDLLDRLRPVDFEYRKAVTQFKLADGSLVREKPADPEQVAEEVRVWTNEGSGEKHRGFIAEDLPQALSQGDGVAALDIAANNTAALQEAKRRILELETRLAPLAPQAAAGAAAVGGAAVGGATATGGTTEGSGLAASLGADGTLSDAEILRLTEAVLKKIGVDPWIEVPLAEAWEEVDETAPVSAPQTVTRYRVDLDTMQVETYTVQETVTQQQPTGRKVKQLKGDVRFDEKTGKFYRWCGLGGATPTQTSAALLGKLLPGLVAVSSGRAGNAAASSGRAGNAAVSFPSSLKPQASSLFSHSWNTGRVRP